MPLVAPTKSLPKIKPTDLDHSQKIRALREKLVPISKEQAEQLSRLIVEAREVSYPNDISA